MTKRFRFVGVGMIGFSAPEHLVGSLVEAQAKINGVPFPPRA
jgi:hypothetical protein